MLRRVLVGTIIIIAAWQIYGVFHRVTAAAAKEKIVAKPVDDPKGPASKLSREPDEADPGVFGMTPLDPPAPPKGPPPVEDVVARGHRMDVLLEKAEQFSEAGRTLDQRAALNQALGLMDEGPHAAIVRTKLAALNTEVFLGKTVLLGDPYALMAAIESGDNFQKIARKYHISSDMVTLLNPDVNPRRLRVGAGIKVVQGPFNMKVVRSDGRLDLYARDMYIRSFPLHFEDGAFLPAGMYKVRPAGKVVTKNAAGALLQRLEISGADEQTLQVRVATLYASPTMRTPASGGAVAGMQMTEPDLGQVFAAMLEGESWVKVEE